MYSSEFRWRAVTLVYVYVVPVPSVARVLGVSERAVHRWYQQFEATGDVQPSTRPEAPSRYPEEVLAFVSGYVKDHPCFYVEELQIELKRRYAHLQLAISHSTILRALHRDLNLTRKVLEKRAREALPTEVEIYKRKLAAFYTYPEQLVFVDETAKKPADSMRKFAWSERGKRAVVKLPFRARVSVLAACSTAGFIGWATTRGTFTRRSFHAGFVKTVVPMLNPWPLPRSIVVIDNAHIHMYRELEEAVHACGAILVFLPPYCPHLNPIEVMFGLLKRWLARHANLAFQHEPEKVLEVAMRECVRTRTVGTNLFRHCGYDSGSLNEAAFTCGHEA